MDIEIEKQAMDLLEEAIELAPDARQTLLSEIESPELITRLQELLDTHEQLTATGGQHFLSVAPGVGSIEEGAEIGAYRLTRLIGRGGMGVVYEAQRADGAFQQNVAIKFLPSLIASSAIRARFHAERQILAQLEHPNIARLIDGGSGTIDGVAQMYLVMELVPGDPFMPDPGRSERATLNAFLQVCEAVQYAHSQLVLHRDIKPDNVRFDALGHPKLLDFGVSKLLSTGPVPETTSLMPVPLTLNYAAPELLDGKPASVVSDVYALGVFLAYLLRGTLPYRIPEKDAYNAHQSVRAALQQLPAPTRELDFVIARAMHADPERRYTSVTALITDLRRYLDGYPIEARGDSTWYVASRFARRNLRALSLLGAAFVGLAITTAIAVFQAGAASQAQQTSERTLEFVQSIFSAVQPRSGGPLGPEGKIYSLIAMGEDLADDTLQDDPEVQMEVYFMLGQTWLGLEQLPELDTTLERIDALLAQHTGRWEDEMALRFQYQSLLISSHASNTRWREGEALCDAHPNATTPDRLRSTAAYIHRLIDCGNVYANTGQPELSRSYAQQAQTWMESPSATQAGVGPHAQLSLQMRLTAVFMGLGDVERIQHWLARSNALAEEIGASAMPQLAMLQLQQSLWPNQNGEFEESLRYTAMALETARRSSMSKGDVLLAYVELYHADRLIDVNRLDEARDVFAPSKEVLLAESPETSHYHALVHFTDYKLSAKSGDYDQAERALLASRGIREDGGEAYTQWQAQADIGLADIYMRTERPEKALPRYKAAYDLYLEMHGESHFPTARAKKGWQAALNALEAKPGEPVD